MPWFVPGIFIVRCKVLRPDRRSPTILFTHVAEAKNGGSYFREYYSGLASLVKTSFDSSNISLTDLG